MEMLENFNVHTGLSTHRFSRVSRPWQGALFTVMGKYHKMDTKKYPNIFECHIMYRTNIRIYLNATYLANKYLNIFVLQK